MNWARLVKPSIFATFAICILGTNALDVAAADPDSKTKQAEKLVEKALFHEIYGNESDRTEFLERAAKLNPNLPAAQWQQGRVFIDGSWLPVETAITKIKDNPKLKQYLKVKPKFAKTLEGHVQLANWCGENKLPAQRRAHLLAALEFDPENETINQLLGRIFVDGRWMSEKDLLAAMDEVVEGFENQQKFDPVIAKILAGLMDESKIKQQAAAQKLREIRDSAAVDSMEMMLSSRNETIANIVVSSLGNMQGDRAALSLTRHAVFSPWESVRDNASVQLRKFKKLDFVPSLLGAMKTEARGIRWVVRGNTGKLIYRHTIFAETQNANEVQIQDTVYERIKRPGGIRAESMVRALNAMSNSLRENTMLVEMERMSDKARNQRICDALKKITAQNLGDDPRAWWLWWNEENGVYQPERKQMLVNHSLDTVRIVDIQRRKVRRGGSGQKGAEQPSVEPEQPSQPQGETQKRKSQPSRRGSINRQQSPRSSQPKIRTPQQRSSRPSQPIESRNIRERLPEGTSEWLEEVDSHPTLPPSAASQPTMIAIDGPQSAPPETAEETEDCLAAGTPVMTSLGFKAIDKIEVGELVLAKDTLTSELTFKPVIRTTIRPKGDLHKIRIGDEWITSSGGHPFWVSGKGWTYAKELQQGMIIHTSSGIKQVEETASAAAGETYNLIVEDFGTYFAGENMILSHDNTVPSGQTGTVPGLSADK